LISLFAYQIAYLDEGSHNLHPIYQISPANARFNPANASSIALRRPMGMRLLLLLSMLMGSISTIAAECRVHSGANVAALLELYTSEGCSSCPPADRWLSTFADRAPAPGSVVPIAFHVAYWDYLGWKDAYASSVYTERQKRFASASGARYVYTPQVVLAGRDFPEWRSAGLKTLRDAGPRPARVRLEIESARGGTSARVIATALGREPGKDWVLFVAATQDGLMTRVKAGENRGETLRHDFVVRDFRALRGWSASSGRALEANVTFSAAPDWRLENMRVVAFVQDEKSGEVLQALAAPFCR
jgi:hypothetical protein